jgi:hypothetical protein
MGDKRTKGVFALYLKRITAYAGAASERDMNRLDDGLSTPRMSNADRHDCCAHRNSACPKPGCFPRRPIPMLAGLAGQRACKHKSSGVPRAWRTVIRMDCTSIHHPRVH